LFIARYAVRPGGFVRWLAQQVRCSRQRNAAPIGDPTHDQVVGGHYVGDFGGVRYGRRENGVVHFAAADFIATVTDPHLKEHNITKAS